MVQIEIKKYKIVRNPISISSVHDENILSILFLVTNHTNQTFINFNRVDDTLQQKKKTTIKMLEVTFDKQFFSHVFKNVRP